MRTRIQESTVDMKADQHFSPTAGHPDLMMLVGTLNGIQDQIRFADTKGGFLATVNALFGGLLASRADRLAAIPPDHRHLAFWVAVVMLLIYCVCTCMSICQVIFSVMPRLRKSDWPGRTHFADIVQRFNGDQQRYRDEVKQLSPTEWADEISAQIVNVSRIAVKKHRFIHRAAVWTMCSFVLWVFAIATMIYL
jgi:Family of unknown function (DUF5706)